MLSPEVLTLGSLLVGVSFAKSFGLALDIPIIDVNHMHGHILAHFIKEMTKSIIHLNFLLCLTLGGHTQIKVNDYLDFDLIEKQSMMQLERL